MNAIVIVLDTFRADIIGQSGALSFVDTPNLDRLAAQSVVFDSAYGEGQPTLQIRRAFYTGCRSFPFVYNTDRRGHFHHAPGWHKIPDHQDTLAEILSAYGYCTGLISDVYHMFKPTMNYWRGFHSYEFLRGQESDNYKGGTPGMIWKELSAHLRDPSDYARHATLYQYLLNQRRRTGEEDYQCARVFRTAADWLDDNAANAPFLLWVEAFDPHEPWDPPRRYTDRYCPGYTGPDFIMPNAMGPSPSTEEVARTRALYCGEVSFVDRWAGHLLDKIEDLGLWDDTLVVVLSDHGTQVWDHGAFGKGGNNLRAYNTRIVWQMRLPGPAAAGKETHVKSLVQSHDVMPTILDALGVAYTRTDGSSVMDLVRGGQDTHRDAVVIGWARFSQGNATAAVSVRTAAWNYVTTTTDEPEHRALYDLVNDPREDENVLADHPDVEGELRRHIEAVIGQPLPARLNEVCDPEPAPMAKYLQIRGR